MASQPTTLSLGGFQSLDRPLRVAGVLSGTSADGIDVALVECLRREGRLTSAQQVAFATLPFEAALAARLRALLDGASPSLREVALLDRDLGLAFGAAAAELARSEGFELDLVGSHGQTLWHHDGDPSCGPASLQLGDGDFVAAAAGSAVVSDFRQADLAAGGEGAPISAYADDLVFHGLPLPLAILNLGGLGNLSWLDDQRVIALDTGPAGALLDGLARRYLDAPLDRDGALAAAGRVLPGLVEELLEHPFLGQDLPRSTGRDTFGPDWVRRVAEGAELAGASPAEVMASAVEFVGASVALGVERHLPKLQGPLLVAGGGVHNRTLMGALGRLIPAGVRSSATAGVDPDAREALVFAVLAARHWSGEGVTRPGATGALPGRVLGKWSPRPFAGNEG